MSGGNVTDLLQVRDLKIDFRVHEGTIKAVDGASFRVRAGSTVAIVGESGSGKSVCSQAIMGILPQNGRIRFDGVDRGREGVGVHGHAGRGEVGGGAVGEVAPVGDLAGESPLHHRDCQPSLETRLRPRSDRARG